MAVRLITGSTVTVTAAGTAVIVDTTVPPQKAVSSVLIQADFANTGRVYVGDENVTAENGYFLEPGNSIEISGDNRTLGQDEVILTDLYIDADNAGSKVRVGFFVKRKGPNW
jgi:hypothetical protein